jgi:hypothetical protein
LLTSFELIIINFNTNSSQKKSNWPLREFLSNYDIMQQYINAFLTIFLNVWFKKKYIPSKKWDLSSSSLLQPHVAH